MLEVSLIIVITIVTLGSSAFIYRYIQHVAHSGRLDINYPTQLKH